MRNNLLQNIDLPQDNPTIPEKIVVKNKLLKNPKIIALMILILIIIILSIIALITPSSQNRRPIIKTTPTPIPNTELVEVPTSSQSQIPQEFQIQFNEIEKELNKTENFLPPQIDSALLP